MFYVYSNLPPANLVPGDVIGFDLGVPNDFIPAFAAISMATSDQDYTGTYTQVVGDVAATSLGDTIIDNFEVQWTLTSSYSFPGGTLIIRFQNGGFAAQSTGFSTDGSCDQVHVYGSSDDASGLVICWSFANFFVEIFYRDHGEPTQLSAKILWIVPPSANFMFIILSQA